MKRKNLLQSREYWLVQIQNDLYGAIENYMKKKKLNRTKLAEKLGVTKGYITQVLNGDFDHKISKLVDLSLSCNKAPVISFVDLDKYIIDDAENRITYYNNLNDKPVQYFLSVNSNDTFIVDKESIASLENIMSQQIPNEVAVQSDSLACDIPNFIF